MKKLLFTLAVLLNISPLAAQTLDQQVTRAVSKAISHQPVHVDVQIKLAKPIYMSDYMWRRPRCKDVIIRWEQKENSCTGTLRTDLQRVYIPATCAQEEKYRISQVEITFANGRKLQTSGKAVRILKDKAFIALQ